MFSTRRVARATSAQTLEHVLTKDPYILTKEFYNLPREPCNSTKEPYILTKEPYNLPKETVPYVLPKEDYICAAVCCSVLQCVHVCVKLDRGVGVNRV